MSEKKKEEVMGMSTSHGTTCVTDIGSTFFWKSLSITRRDSQKRSACRRNRFRGMPLLCSIKYLLRRHQGAIFLAGKAREDETARTPRVCARLTEADSPLTRANCSYCLSHDSLKMNYSTSFQMNDGGITVRTGRPGRQTNVMTSTQ